MDTYWITLGALILSAGTFCWGVWSVKHGLQTKADTDYVQSLERRLELAETALIRCRRSEEALTELCEGLERRNIQLMKMLVEKGEKEEGEL